MYTTMDEGESSPLVGPQARLWDGDRDGDRDRESQRDLSLGDGGRKGEPESRSTWGLILLTMSIGGYV